MKNKTKQNKPHDPVLWSYFLGFLGKWLVKDKKKKKVDLLKCWTERQCKLFSFFFFWGGDLIMICWLSSIHFSFFSFFFLFFNLTPPLLSLRRVTFSTYSWSAWTCRKSSSLARPSVWRKKQKHICSFLYHIDTNCSFHMSLLAVIFRKL